MKGLSKFNEEDISENFIIVLGKCIKVLKKFFGYTIFLNKEWSFNEKN